MPPLRTTIGRLVLNEALPEELRDYGQVLDRKGAEDLFRRLATRTPDRYTEVSKRLTDLARRAATETGGYSFGPEHLSKAQASRKISQEISNKLNGILNDRSE